MSTESSNAIAALKDTPFELLQELERRSKLALAGPADGKGDAQEWVGVGFRLGTDWLLVWRHEVREVMIIPSEATRVPGVKPWVVGLANIRGQLLPLVDLKQFLGAGTGGGHAARVLVLNSREFPLGIIVDEVIGFRRFLVTEYVREFPDTVVRCERYLDGSYNRGEDTWPIFNMAKLLETKEFQHVAVR
jgi:twitching motility protein PilI